jgi:hypothetical protein
MASLAEMERELTVERTRAGLEVARQLGRKGGRKRQMTDSKIESAKKLLANGVPPRDVAMNLGVSVPTLYRWVDRRAWRGRCRRPIPAAAQQLHYWRTGKSDHARRGIQTGAAILNGTGFRDRGARVAGDRRDQCA